MCGENTHIHVTDSTHTHSTQWLHLKVYLSRYERLSVYHDPRGGNGCGVISNDMYVKLGGKLH